MKTNFPSWSNTMEPLVKKIEKSSSTKYIPSCDLIGKKIDISSCRIETVDGFNFVVVRFTQNSKNDEFFTCTWHPQPVELIRIIIQELENSKISVYVKASNERMVEYSFYN